MNKIFKKVSVNGFKVKCNPDGELQGSWSDPENDESKLMYTMT
jgi:hypothetical protein